MFSADGKKYYWSVGDTVTFALRTKGSIQVIPDKGGKMGRFFGNIGARHLHREPMFDGKKWAICRADGCPWCARGFRKNHEVWGIPVTIEGRDVETTFSLAQNNTLAYYFEKVEREGRDPTSVLYKMCKTGLKGRDAWTVEVVTMSPTGQQTQITTTAPKVGAAVDTGVTDAEKHIIEILIATMNQVNPTASKEEWVVALDKRGFAGRSDRIYDTLIKPQG